MTEKYCDPKDTVEVLNNIKECKTLGEVKNLMEKIFPGLFITVLDDYCNEYPHLRKNWETICSSAKTTPKQIMILDDYSEDVCTVVKSFAECFTTAGFSVRRKCEYIPCEKCFKIAVPTPTIYELFRVKKFRLPEVWSKFCKSCKSCK